AAPQKSLFSALGVVVDPESEKPPEKGWPPTPIEVRRDEPPFAVQLHRRDRLQFVKSSEPEPEEPEDCDSCEPEEDASPTVRVAPRDQPRLVETWRLAGETDDSQGVMLRFTLGEGSIALLTETDWLTNDELAEEDHAALLLAAVEREPAPLGVTLVRALDYPSLFGLIGRYGWMALVSGGLLVAAWLAKNGPRFGPLLPDPPLARRSLLEHIGASAEFLRRRRQTRALLESTRRALRRHAAARLPEGGGTPGRRQFELWASQTGVPPETLEWAMSSPAPDDPEGLSRMIQTIEEVRRAL
ncbi:MAG TPA: hypothetical protein PK413_16680, partial [Thermoanaerobaculia bacterium]|nr:hypothetical protein [Thermoanaerobaculia bacterium]